MGRTWSGHPRNLEMDHISRDRQDLGNEMRELVDKLSYLYAEWEGEHQIAWQKDTINFRGMQEENFRQHSMELTNKYIQQYGKHVGECQSLIALAKKYVSIDRSDFWRIQHGVRSPHDVHEMIIFLSSLSATLLTGLKSEPETDRILQASTSDIVAN